MVLDIVLEGPVPVFHLAVNVVPFFAGLALHPVLVVLVLRVFRVVDLLAVVTVLRAHVPLIASVAENYFVARQLGSR